MPLLASLFASALVGGGTIDPALEQRLASSPPDRSISVLVLMDTRPDTEALLRTTRGLARDDRAPAVAERLRALSALDQADLIARIDQLRASGEVFESSLLWIVNGHRVAATPDAIRALAESEGVASVRWDRALAAEELQDSSPSPAAAPGGTAAAPPYSTSFETGATDAAWITTAIPGSSATVTQGFEPSDQDWHLLLSGASIASATLALDLSAVPGALLEFDLRTEGSAGGSLSGLYLAHGAGSSTLVTTFADEKQYHRYSVDLRTAAEVAGIGLASVNGVRFVWDGATSGIPGSYAIDDVVLTSASSPGFDAEANIWALQAPRLWELGFEGDGVLVLCIDQAFDLNHVAITNSVWQNPGEAPFGPNGVDDDGNGYVDDVVGWNMISNSNQSFYSPSDSHGTRVAGLIVGDGTGNDGRRTGMAPGVELAVATINSEAQAFEAYQYAITIGADVIASSLSFKLPGQPTYSDFRTVSEVELAAGLIHANSVGNNAQDLVNYPLPWNIAAPGNCPGPWRHPQQVDAGLGAVLGCGGLHLATEAIYVDGGQGPAAWEDVALSLPGYSKPQDPAFWDYPWAGGSLPGLIKPDLAAYVDVRTTTVGAGYGQFSGTSSATPQVGGAVALLIDANPTVPPRQISQALQETAWDLGPAGKDPRYGAGKVQAYDAAMKIIAAVTATPQEAAAGQTIDLAITGPTASLWVLGYSLATGTTPTPLGIDLGLGAPFWIFGFNFHTGWDTPTVIPVAAPGVPSGTEIYLQLLTDDSLGLTGKVLTSLVERIRIQ